MHGIWIANGKPFCEGFCLASNIYKNLIFFLQNGKCWWNDENKWGMRNLEFAPIRSSVLIDHHVNTEKFHSLRKCNGFSGFFFFFCVK